MPKSCEVYVHACQTYDLDSILSVLTESLFVDVAPGSVVILKPNWVMESHRDRPDDWEYVITHPVVITAVLQRVLAQLKNAGRVIIIDGPMTEASFEKLISRYPVDLWLQMADQHGVALEIVDLREHQWETINEIIVDRKALPGDPRGKVLVNLCDENSEFWGHRKSRRGYYGADYNLTETNQAHDGSKNLYSVSKSVIEGDVFINLPKLKTHRKSGITCCLKNLVGINTYKNYLPHHCEGGPAEGGDQFPTDDMRTRMEGPLVTFLKQHVFKDPLVARLLSPLNTVAKMVFGDSRKVVRSGSWYGNDTIWRMIIDLNKVLFYANPDGKMRAESLVSAKHYIGIVDAILAGEGEGPLAPDPINMGRLICGTNPVAIDAVCACLMGFDPVKIPVIAHAFKISRYPLCDFTLKDIAVTIDGVITPLQEVQADNICPFEPQYGWKGHIEKSL
jgi:uncharacterized protein (DUF362 family)